MFSIFYTCESYTYNAKKRGVSHILQHVFTEFIIYLKHRQYFLPYFASTIVRHVLSVVVSFSTSRNAKKS